MHWKIFNFVNSEKKLRQRACNNTKSTKTSLKNCFFLTFLMKHICFTLCVQICIAHLWWTKPTKSCFQHCLKEICYIRNRGKKKFLSRFLSILDFWEALRPRYFCWIFDIENLSMPNLYCTFVGKQNPQHLAFSKVWKNYAL